jgi:Holliday junction resolvasome RuvABC ATP-dependent DNA helicase subunit
MFDDNTVGQSAVKSKLNFFADCFKRGGVSPHLLFVAPKGTGKTHFAILYGKGLEAILPEKKVRLVNCSSIKGVKGFFNDIIIPHVTDKDVTFIFDEASELPKDVTMALLTILNPNPSNTTSFCYGDYTADFDFRRQTFLFATSEPHKVFHALMDRLTRVDLQDYKVTELAEILQRGTPNVVYEDNLLVTIAETLRGNARQATKMAVNINNFIGTEKHNSVQFAAKDWQELSKNLNIMPLGINENELSLLRVLRERVQCTLTAIAASTGMTRTSIQRDVETYLLKRNLISIETAGRRLTIQGSELLKNLDKASI